MPTGQELLDAKIADVKLKIKNSTSPKLTKGFVRKLRNLQQKAGNQRIGIDAKSGTKGRVAVDTGKQAHHRTSLNNAAAFFEDLDIPEKTIIGQKFAQYGLVPGDLTMNRLDMFAELHQGGIHAIERFLGLEGKPYFKPGATLVEKLAAVESFAADQKLLSSLADRMQFSAEFKTPGLTERVLSTATTKSAEEYKTKANRRLANQKLDFLQYIPEQHEVATALGPQLQSQNKARLAALDAYFNDDNSFDVARLKKDVNTNKFVLPTPEPATPFEMSKGSAKLNRNLSKFGKGASKLIPGSLDDAIIGGVLATGAAGATLLTGGSLAQAGEAFLETGVDVATGDLQGGNLADTTLQTNLDKVKKTLYQEPVNIAAPTGVTTFDAVAQPLIKGLAGQPMGLKRNKGSIIFGF